MCRERRTAHAGEAAVPDCLHKTLEICDFRGLDALPRGLLSVCLNNDPGIIPAVCRTNRVDPRNCSRHARINRCTHESIRVTDQLANFHLVALLNDRIAWLTNMLGKRNSHHSRYWHDFGFTSSRVLIMTGINAWQMLSIRTHL